MKHKYQIVSSEIEDKIFRKIYVGKLPTENQLIREYDVSRNTIRKAVNVLILKGVIIPIQGSGFFIREVSKDGAINLETFRGLTEDFKGQSIVSEIIEFKEINSDETISKIMKCDLNTPLYYLKRLRIVEGQRWVIEYSYYNRTYVPYLNREILEGSIYNYVREGLNKQIGYIDRVIEADFLSKEDAALLGLNEGDPALISKNVSMLKSGEIFDYSIDVHNYKLNRFMKLSNFSY